MRLIDADALLDKVKDYGEGQERLLLIDPYWVRKAPTVERPQWIPCSEQLPDEGEVVLTQAKFKDDIKMAVSARVDFNYWTGWGTREINIVAWMPLPKPYEKEGDEK